MNRSEQGNDLTGQNLPNERLIIGLAGPMAAGKNIAADILAQKGFAILDADKMVHEVLDNEKEKVISLFADEARKRNISLTNKDGTINRANLAPIVFANKRNLTAHEAIIHPKIDQLFEHYLNSNPKTSYVINAALLHKSSVIKRCNCVLFIDAPFLLRFKRVKTRNNLPFLQIFKRFWAQLKIFDKCKKLNADIYRVENSGTKESLEHKIQKALDSCLKKG